jgi:two-component system, NtrC family, sensor kinase
MRLARNLILGVALALIAVLSLEGYFEVQSAYAVFEADMREDGRWLGRSIARAFDAASSGRPGPLQISAQGAHVGMRVLPLEAALARMPSGAHVRPPAGSGLAPGEVLQWKGEDRRLYTYVGMPGQPRFVLETSEDLAPLRAHARASALRAVVRTSLTAIAFIVLVLFVGSVYVGKPLAQLGEMARLVGRGDYSRRLRFRRRDELRDLAESMNGMCEDLTQARVRIEEETRSRIAALEQLRHADRLVTVGQLAAGVAHELGTPLNVIGGHARMIVNGEVQADEARESARVALEQTQRMTTIVRQLLDFSRRRPAQRSAAPIDEISRATVRMLAPVAQKKAVALELAVREPGLLGQVDAVQIQQALTNLIMNAIQAVPSTSGHVEVECARGSASGAHAACAQIRVSDDGPGITPEDRERVFEPFFTTKDVGEGTGLGLAVAIGLVRENGGTIEVSERIGGGTVFCIVLPLAEVV